MKTNGNQIEEWTLTHWSAPPPPLKRRNADEGLISPASNQQDWECMMLADFGMGAKAIAKFTGLTPAQISYRLAKWNMSLRSFREGRGPYARIVFGNLVKRREIAEMLAGQSKVLNEGLTVSDAGI